MTHSTRRGFLAGLSGPVILGAANKSGSALPVIGADDHKYEVIHDWGELPANIRYGNTHGVCTDSQGRVYIHHTVNKASESHDSMVVFDGQGKFVKSWGKEFEGGAHGLHIAGSGRNECLYLCDTQKAVVVKTTLAGDEVWTLRYPREAAPYAEKIKYSPTNLAIAPNGDIYVGDGYGSSYINQYNSQGEYIRTFGGKGAAAGQLDCPHGLIVDTRGATPLLVVADRGNKRLQRFTLDGRHIDFVGGVSMPCHFHVFRNGDMVVPDLDARVHVMDRENRVVATLGADDSKTWGELRKQPREQFQPGKFVCPHGACFDRDGNIFVVEWVEVGRVTKLRKVA